ncbi:hypothetical protein Tco_1495137 [Tanacetum coccineum]
MVSKVPDTKDTIKFFLNTKQFTYTVDMFRDILQLPVETPENPFVTPANIHTIEAFMNRVGYQGVVDKVSAFFTKNLAQPWQTMFKVFNRCLTTRTYGHDQTKINILQLFHDLIVADLMKKFPDIPKRLEKDYHSIKDDVPLVSVYTTRNVSVRGMLISDAFLTAKIRETNDFKEYKMVFMKKDDDDSENRIEREKKDDEMGSLEIRNEETQTTIPTPLSSPRKILSSDKKTFQELKNIVSNPTISTSRHSQVKKKISSKYSHLPGALRRMCRHQDRADYFALWEALRRKFEKSSTSNTSCREDDFHSHHDEHQDDNAPPEG